MIHEFIKNAAYSLAQLTDPIEPLGYLEFNYLVECANRIIDILTTLYV